MRGIAILLIILSHCTFATNTYGNGIFKYAGGFGVEIFIVLSGYLTYHNYSNKKSVVGTWETLKRKAKKIYPLHIVTFVASLPLCLYIFSEVNYFKTGINLLLNLLMVNSWIPKMEVYYSFNFVAWYLTLVFFFIIIAPILIKRLQSLSNKKLIIIAAIIIMGQFLWAGLVQGSFIQQWLVYICPLVRSLDFILGAIVYRIVERTKTNKLSNIDLIGIFSIVLSLGLLYFSLNIDSVYYMVAVWSIPALLLVAICALGNNKSKVIIFLFQNSIILFIGSISFELFLIHQLVIRYMQVLCGKLEIEISILHYIIAIWIAVLAGFVWQKFSSILIDKLKVTGDKK